MLVASPAARGLFHRAISESGGAVSPTRGTLKMAEESGKAFLSKLGADDIKAARALSAETIQEGLKGAMMGFWPVAEDSTIMANPYALFEAGKFNDTPILVGTNSHEGRLFSARKTTGAEFEQTIRGQYPLGAEELLKAYPHETDDEATRSTQDIMRDTIFAWPTWAWAKLQSRNGKNKVFVYYFDHRTPASPDGADHGSEISYVFGNLGGFGGTDGPEAEALHELMSSYWVNFAENGDPNGEGLPEWPEFDEKEQQVMVIDGESGARKHPNLEKLMAFDAYYAKLRESMKTE